MNFHAPTLQRSLSDVVAEYEHKRANIAEELATFEKAGGALTLAATIGGTYGRTTLDTGRVGEHVMQESLLKSAWHHVYDGLNIARICSAEDKRRFEQGMNSPAPFTIENIRSTFGKFILDPRGNILRGLAEVFCSLDQAYKSHDKIKIGVAGLPKRVILSNVSSYGSWGRDKLVNVLNALAAVQGLPLVEHYEIDALLKDECALLVAVDLPKGRYDTEVKRSVARGVRLRRFANGNGHLFFEPDTLRATNKALAEYYGDVLPDTTDERPTRPRAGTAVAKDLQFYATPAKVADDVVSEIYNVKGMRALEPSCGDGRLLDALRKAGASVFGVEVDAGRAAQARAKGHRVLLANFLETVPTGDYDLVLMNPPFYGKHYAKHVRHAVKFLRPGGKLVAILPATARYDHGLLEDLGGRWQDLPVGSFSESGTNINTCVLAITIR